MDELSVLGIRESNSIILSDECSSTFSRATKLSNIKAIDYVNSDSNIDFNESINEQMTSFASLIPSVNDVKMHVTQVLDLKETKNINEVCAILGSDSLPNSIEVYSFIDGINYTQYGTAYDLIKFRALLLSM